MKMNYNWDEVIIPGLTGFFGALITWLFGRKKESVDLQSSEITNVQEAIKIWREMATDLKAEVADLKIKVDSLTTEIHNLRSENVELRAKLDENQPNKPKRIKPNKEV
jgi:predicted RNase H-like nuclease (RuvC/YqgF family)